MEPSASASHDTTPPPSVTAAEQRAEAGTESLIAAASTIQAATPHDPSNAALPTDPIEQANQAPGIPDRRRSTRPSERPVKARAPARGRGRGLARRSAGRTSMASIQDDVKPRSDEEDSPGDKGDQFEDATATPKPVTPEPGALPNADAEATPTVNGQKDEEQEQTVNGLGITGDGSDDAKQTTIEMKDETQPGDEKSPPPQVSARMSFFGGDDAAYTQNGSAETAQKDAQDVDGATPGPESDEKLTELNPAAMPEPTRSSEEKRTPPDNTKLKRLSLLEDSATLMPRPGTHERARSRSPARFPVKNHDPSDSTSQPPPSITERASSPDRKSAPSTRPQSTSPTRQPSGGIAKKASSGFGAFLARATSIRRTAKSPPGPRPESKFLQRRDTGASVASVDSNAGVVTSIAEEGEETKKPSLQDQFRNLRRQQEETLANGHVKEDDDDNEKTPVAQRQSDAGVSDPASLKRRGSESLWRRSESTPDILKTPPLNQSLPPGTATGMSAGPAQEAGPVNWDLWQKVVCEGPAAVARSSGEELNLAIATGIPAAIRGVVWQVLAESKDENLEGMYRTLKARGSGEDQPSRPPISRADTANSINGTINEKDSVTSSRSSVHSESSTPATSNVASPPASVDGNALEFHAKLLAEKQKREAASISKLEKAIKRDLGSRTSYSKFTQSAGLQDGLFGVCKAFALFDEAVGYAQGINFIAMPLLFNMTEEESFSLLVRLMHKYDLRSLFTADMPGLHRRLYQFERLLEDHEPALYCHLRRRNVQPQLYATQWFLTLFAYRFPLQLVLRVYDLIFSEGLSAILKFGIVLMQKNRDALMSMKDMGQLTQFLKEKIFDVYIDKSPSASSLLDSGFFGSVSGGADKELYRADELVRDACTIAITDDILARYSAEWEESQRVERERETELDSLRSAHASLATQVKALEERVQQHDAEHVNIAGDLVRTKVENDRLQDENEGLRMRTDELQKVIDVQPAEVEARLKHEMERIMLRNIEVQNENRHIKEEMDEMEHELVNAKMAHAEMLSESDALKQKWSSVQALLNDKA